jgi:hypothetical protein
VSNERRVAMTFFGGGGKNAKMTPRPTGRPDSKSILPIGGRVLVTQESPGDGSVPLSDEPGHTRVGSVSVGTEAEVTAWRPRGGWGTRYRIRVDEGCEGWVDAANLRARPEPEPPRRAPAPPPIPVSAASPKPSAKPRVKPNAAKPDAKSSVKRVAKSSAKRVAKSSAKRVGKPKA